MAERPDIFHDIGKGVSKATHAVEHAGEQAGDAVAGGAKDAAGAVAHEFDQLSKEAQKQIMSVFDDLKKQLTELGKQAEKGITDAANTAKKGIVDAEKQAEKGVTDAANSAKQGIVDAEKSAVKGVTDAADSAKDGITSAAKSAEHEIDGAKDAAISKVKDAVGPELDQIKGVAVEGGKALKKVTLQGVDILKKYEKEQTKIFGKIAEEAIKVVFAEILHMIGRKGVDTIYKVAHAYQKKLHGLQRDRPEYADAIDQLGLNVEAGPVWLMWSNFLTKSEQIVAELDRYRHHPPRATRAEIVDFVKALGPDFVMLDISLSFNAVIVGSSVAKFTVQLPFIDQRLVSALLDDLLKALGFPKGRHVVVPPAPTGVDDGGDFVFPGPDDVDGGGEGSVSDRLAALEAAAGITLDDPDNPPSDEDRMAAIEKELVAQDDTYEVPDRTDGESDDDYMQDRLMEAELELGVGQFAGSGDGDGDVDFDDSDDGFDIGFIPPEVEARLEAIEEKLGITPPDPDDYDVDGDSDDTDDGG